MYVNVESGTLSVASNDCCMACRPSMNVVIMGRVADPSVMLLPRLTR